MSVVLPLPHSPNSPSANGGSASVMTFARRSAVLAKPRPSAVAGLSDNNGMETLPLTNVTVIDKNTSCQHRWQPMARRQRHACGFRTAGFLLGNDAER